MEKKEFNKKMGKYLKKERLRRGVTQLELASKIGTDFQNISRIERGEVSPTLYWFNKITEALEMRLGDFVNDAFDDFPNL